MLTSPEYAYHLLAQDTANSGFVAIHAPVQQTGNGTLYVQKPGVVVVARPHINLAGLETFLAGYGEESHFSNYIADPDWLSSGTQLIKVAGQLCYMSFGAHRSMNSQAKEYLNHLKASGHGSVFEHANYSLLLYGVSRSLTHELIRHRSGISVSQQSQRYVSGARLRFVERPEYAQNPKLHDLFLERIDRAAREYTDIAMQLIVLQQAGDILLSGEAKTDQLKKVRQAARSVLPNETEAPILLTGNARAWRHVISTRANVHAEVEIRELAMRIFLCLYQIDHLIFNDYTLDTLADGTASVSTAFEKI